MKLLDVSMEDLGHLLRCLYIIWYTFRIRNIFSKIIFYANNVKLKHSFTKQVLLFICRIDLLTFQLYVHYMLLQVWCS